MPPASRPLRLLLASVLLIILPACNGAFGTWQSVHYESAPGGYSATVRARGLTLVSLPGTGGLTLGSDDFVAFYPRGEVPGKVTQQGLLITLPRQAPMHLSRRVCGLSASWSPVFTGVTAGGRSSSVTQIDLNDNVELRMDVKRGDFLNRTFSLRTNTHNSP